MRVKDFRVRLLFLVLAFLLSACSPGRTGAPEAVLPEAEKEAAALPDIKEEEKEEQEEEKEEREEKRKTLTIACLGDSITYGIGTKDREKESYPAVLESLFGDGADVLNLGCPNAMASEGRDYSYDTLPVYDTFLLVKADLYLIMLGTNDSIEGIWDPEAYRLGMEKYIRECRNKNPEARICILTPLMAYEKGGEVLAGIQPVVIEEEIRPILKELSRELGTGLADCFSLSEDMKAELYDGVHPGAEGYALLAEFIYEEIREDMENLLREQKQT